MDQNGKYSKKNERRRQRVFEVRKDAVMMEYIRVKHNVIYNEAVGFYEDLNRKHPDKKDLRKTCEFRIFMANEKPMADPPTPKPLKLRFGERGIIKDDFMELGIPLISPNLVTTRTHEDTTTEIIQETETHEDTTTEIIQETETHEDTITEIIQEGTVNAQLPQLADEITGDSIQPSLLEELNPDLIDQIIEELKADQDLYNIMTDIEQTIESDEFGMDIL